MFALKQYEGLATCTMHKLYWKIFLSFWCATSLIVLSTVWVTGVVTRKSSVPVSERIFMNSYAHAAVATYESGKREAVKKWLETIALSKHLTFFLLSSNGDIISIKKPPESIIQLQKKFINELLPVGIFKIDNLIVSHEFLTLSQNTYRLVSIQHTPISHLTQIPWADITLELCFTILISGLICYLLSRYLTKPLRTLRRAAKAIACGKLETRVNKSITNRHDEFADLGLEFDYMAEQIEQLILSKQRLLQDISHELRSPLARLHVAVALARDKTRAACGGAEFDRMELEIKRLDSLIGEILSFAKLHSPSTALNKTKNSISDILKPIVDDANFEFSKNNTRAVLTLDKEYTFISDSKLLHHAFENIIRNALRYTHENTTVAVEVNTDNESLTVTVTDEGPGVPPASLSLIFSPFYRVDSARTPNTGGFGIGLAIAKKAIELHQGSIKADNIEPNGLKVTIKLPLQ